METAAATAEITNISGRFFKDAPPTDARLTRELMARAGRLVH